MMAVRESKPEATHLFRVGVACPFILLAVLLSWASASHAADCATPLAQLVLIKGSVELVRQGTPRLAVAEVNSALCAGDTVVVHQRSQAALLLTNATIVRLDQGTTVTLSPSSTGRPALLSVISGAIYVISRTPQPFRVRTPFINANVEGTEFVVEVRREVPEAGADCVAQPGEGLNGQDRVLVVEGRVSVSNSSETSQAVLRGGEAATARSASSPLTLSSGDRVTWALHPPRLALDPATSPRSRCAQTLIASGNLSAAKAALGVEVSRPVEARTRVDSSTFALSAVISVAENNIAQATIAADEAVRLDPTSSLAWYVQSYVQQSRLELDSALESAKRAATLDPGSNDAWARVSDVQLALGNSLEAAVAARRAVEISPSDSRSLAALGFASLATGASSDAVAYFQSAIASNNADPFARLGLGLALIQAGDLSTGRGEIEVAAAFDPGNSSIRSYLGRAYLQERRHGVAKDQFELAKKNDAKDPTPYSYLALTELATNDPVGAIENSDKAIALNGSRAVIRSRLLIDNDAAVRAVAQASAYQQAGLDRLALSEAYRAWIDDPSSAYSHQFLAGAYATEPRYEQARASELLQAQMLESGRVIRTDPSILGDRAGTKLRLAVDPLLLPGYGEYSAAFGSKGVNYSFDVAVASAKTRAEGLFIEAASGPWSAGLLQAHYSSGGFEQNSDYNRNAYDLVVKRRLGPQTTVLMELLSLSSERGDTLYGFDPDAIEVHRLKERADSARLGLHHDFGNGNDVLVVATRQREDTTNPLVGDTDFFLNREDVQSIEAQYIRRGMESSFIFGLGYLSSNTKVPQIPDFKTKRIHKSAYALWNYRIATGLTASLGGAFDDLETDGVRERHMFSPRLGMTWSPVENLTLRASSVASVKRRQISNQTLEPSQLAGFNQFFDDNNGTIARRNALAIDQRIGRDLFLGAEISRRNLRVPLQTADGFQDYPWREKNATLYVYSKVPKGTSSISGPNWSLTTGVSFEYEGLHRPDDLTGTESIQSLQTRVLPIWIRAFHSSGLSARIAATHVVQTGSLLFFPGFNSFNVEGRFNTVDLDVSYRLPGGVGKVFLGANNMLDKRFTFVDTDPVRRRFVSGRQVIGGVTLSF